MFKTVGVFLTGHGWSHAQSLDSECYEEEGLVQVTPWSLQAIFPCSCVVIKYKS